MSAMGVMRARAAHAAGNRCSGRGGFTLIELLTVIAIIGVLAAILIPSTAAVRNAAKRARTKAQFSQWATAMELFRQEYGFYPAVDAGTGRLDSARFAAALTGRALDGSEIAATGDVAGNVRRVAFLRLAEADFDASHTLLADGFGNTEIAVLVDRDGDGRITSADGPARAVTGTDGVGRVPDPGDLDLRTGLRAGVIFYSAGNGASEADLVLSWK